MGSWMNGWVGLQHPPPLWPPTLSQPQRLAPGESTHHNPTGVRRDIPGFSYLFFFAGDTDLVCLSVFQPLSPFSSLFSTLYVCLSVPLLSFFFYSTLPLSLLSTFPTYIFLFYYLSLSLSFSLHLPPPIPISFASSSPLFHPFPFSSHPSSAFLSPHPQLSPLSTRRSNNK